MPRSYYQLYLSKYHADDCPMISVLADAIGVHVELVLTSAIKLHDMGELCGIYPSASEHWLPGLTDVASEDVKTICDFVEHGEVLPPPASSGGLDFVADQLRDGLVSALRDHGEMVAAGVPVWRVGIDMGIDARV